MLGISGSEFLVILLVAMIFIPAKQWPVVAKFFARCVSGIRRFINKISETTNQVAEQIELEKPIDEMVIKSTNEVLESFSSSINTKIKKRRSRT